MSRTFTIATDDRLIALVESARRRLVIVSPGLWKPVAEAVVKRLHDPDGPAQFSLILDVDPEVCRLGFGDVESIDLLNEALMAKGSQLQRQDGVRIGLVISDDEILIYSPTPKLIEAGSTAEEKPNAIQLSGDAGESLSKACGVGAAGGGDSAEQEVGLDFVDAKKVESVKKDLKENPPKQFDLARLERVFNYKLEFVDFKAEHYKLDTKDIPLSPELLGLTSKNLQDRFRNSFRVFKKGVPFRFKIKNPDDPETEIELTEDLLSEWAADIRKRFFISLRRKLYGNLMLRRRKTDFLKEVETFKTLMETYKTEVQKAIKKEITETRAELIADLFPRVEATPPKSWLEKSATGRLDAASLCSRLETEINLAFGKVEHSFHPAVTCLFKGVTYETITGDPEFKNGIINYFGKDEAAKLFEEYEASRGNDQNSSPSPDPDDEENEDDDDWDDDPYAPPLRP